MEETKDSSTNIEECTTESKIDNYKEEIKDESQLPKFIHLNGFIYELNCKLNEFEQKEKILKFVDVEIKKQDKDICIIQSDASSIVTHNSSSQDTNALSNISQSISVKNSHNVENQVQIQYVDNEPFAYKVDRWCVVSFRVFLILACALIISSFAYAIWTEVKYVKDRADIDIQHGKELCTKNYTEKCIDTEVVPLMVPHCTKYKKCMDFGPEVNVGSFSAFWKVIGESLNNFITQLSATTYIGIGVGIIAISKAANFLRWI